MWILQRKHRLRKLMSTQPFLVQRMSQLQAARTPIARQQWRGAV